MNINDKANQKSDKLNEDDAISDVSAAEAEAVAGGAPSPVLPSPGPMAPPKPPPIE